MDIQDVLPSELIAALKHQTVVPIVAAGVSMSVCDTNGEGIFPSWLTLLKKAAEKLQESDGEARKLSAAINVMLDLKDYQSAADYARKGLIGQSWSQFFNEHFQYDLSTVKLDLAEAIWKLSNSIITLNYDKVMETACHNTTLRVYDNHSKSEICMFSDRKDSVPELWHLHGQVDNVGDIIFTSESYNKLYAQSPETSEKYIAAITRLKSLSSTKQFLFIGCSMDDVNLLEKLSEQDEIFDKGTGPHFILVKKSDFEFLKEKLKHVGVNFKFVLFEDFGLPLLDRITQMSGYCNIPINLPAAKPEPVNDANNCQIAVLYPQPLDNQLDFSEPLKELKKIKAGVHYYPLNLQRLNNLDNMDYIIILSHVVGDGVIIEDEYLCQEIMPVTELISNIGNAESKGVFLLNDKAFDRHDLIITKEPVMVIPGLDRRLINKFLFHVFNKHANYFDFNEDLMIFNENKFIRSKLTGKSSGYSVTYETSLPNNVSINQVQKIIGRKNDIENIVRKILKLSQARSGCFTVKGAGGLGKTMCIQKSAFVLARDGRFLHGIRFVDSSPIRTFKTLETEVLSAFELEGVQNALDMIEGDEYRREDRLVILDNAETLLHLEEKSKILQFLQIISSFCTLVTTSREPLGIEYVNPYELRHLNTEEARELFIRHSPFNKVNASDKYLLQNEILEELLGNQPLAIKIIASTMPKGTSLITLRDDLIFSNDLFVNDGFGFFNNIEDENIERQSSIFNCIAYSYQKLEEEEKNVFNILSLFPDGLPLAQLKTISKKNNYVAGRIDVLQKYIPISENIIRSLQDKSMIESRDGMQCQHAMLRRYADKKIMQSKNKEFYYRKAFKHNYALMESLHDDLMTNVGGDTNSFVYINANILKNNFIHTVRFYGCYSGDYDLQLRYLYIAVGVLHGCEKHQQFSQVVKSIPKDFAKNKKDQLFLDVLEINLRYYGGDFVAAYEDLKYQITAEEVLLLDFSDYSSRRVARAAMAIYQMEGDVLGSMVSSVLESRSNNLPVVSYPAELYLIGEYDSILMGLVSDSFYKFEAQLNLGSLDVKELQKHCESIYVKDNITRIQCYYALAKADGISYEIIDGLKVVNPYTAGLKQIILAWKEKDFSKANSLYKMALENLIHIKYYYVEVLYYYCVFLKDRDEALYSIELNRGTELARYHHYRFLLHKFIQLESESDDSYNTENYPLSDDFPLLEYKGFIFSAMN